MFHSLIIDPWGRILAEAGQEPGVIVADIDPTMSQATRANLGNAPFADFKKTAAMGAMGGRGKSAPADAEVLGAVVSAPLGDVLALALDDSDNALTENVARQVAAAHGVGTSTAEVSDWVQQTLRDAGIDLTGVTLADGTEFEIDIRGRRAQAEIQKRPLYRPAASAPPATLVP